MKKILLIFVIFYCNINNSYAYTPDNFINIYYTGSGSFSNMYTVPNGKDLVIKNIRYNLNNASTSLGISNDGVNYIANIHMDSVDNNVNIIIQDDLYLVDGNVGNEFNISGFLVDENEDIQSYIEGNSTAWTKHIFTQDDINFVYFREFIIFIGLLFVNMFEKIIGRKLPGKIF